MLGIGRSGGQGSVFFWFGGVKSRGQRRAVEVLDFKPCGHRKSVKKAGGAAPLVLERGRFDVADLEFPCPDHPYKEYMNSYNILLFHTAIIGCSPFWML